MASLPVHSLLPITSPCFQTMLTKWLLQQRSDPDQARGLDLQNAFSPLKKIKKSFFLKSFSWPVSQPFPTNSSTVVAELQGHCTAAQRLGEEQGDGVRGRNTSGHYCHQGQDIAEPQPYFLLLAWLILTAGLWGSYLASLHLSTSISYIVKRSHRWLPNLVKIEAAHEVFSVNA